MKSFFACLLISLLVTSWTNADDEAQVSTTEGPPPTFGPGPHCTGAQNIDFLKCLGGVLQAHFDDLDKRGQKHIDEKIKLIQACYTKNGCTVKIDFNQPLEEVFDDADVKALIKGVEKFLDGTSREFLKCLVTDLRDKIVVGMEKCIKKDASFFAVPKPYPDLPFPAEAAFTDKAKRAILKKELVTIVHAFISLKDCTEKEKVGEIVKCLLKPLADPIIKCTKTKICAIPGCKADLPGVCTIAGKCIKDKLADAANFLKGDNQNKILELMGNCEKQANIVYKTPSAKQYARADVVKLYTLAKKVAADAEKNEKFKSYIEIFSSKFDAGKVFCTLPCK